MSLNLNLNITPKFRPFLEPKRYKVAYGGRGSGKSWTVAQLLVMKAMTSSCRILCAREIQKSISDSVIQLLDDTINRMGVQDYFEVQRNQILGPNGSRFIFEGLRANITKIKSMEGIDIVWVEEAESVTSESWDTLIPTIRKPKSEIWITFNPRRQLDATYQRFVITPPPNAYVEKVNYSDNPWFPPELEKERKHMMETDFDLYQHIWEGECLTSHKGAYYQDQMRVARTEGRITHVPWEPTLMTQTWWDLGMKDSTAIWFTQTAGREIRFIDYEEHSGEGLPFYAKLLQEKPYIYDAHNGPHDLAVRELGSGRSRIEIARELGIHFHKVRNIGIQDGIEAARSLFPRCWFDQEKCRLGIDALASYHKEYDEINQVYKQRPVHDWSSHGADAFRYFAVGFEEPMQMTPQIVSSF